MNNHNISLKTLKKGRQKVKSKGLGRGHALSSEGGGRVRR